MADEHADSWSALEGVATPSDGDMLIGFLQSHGIPARMVDRTFHMAPAVNDDLGPIAIAVPTERLEEARAALAKREKAFAATPGDDDDLMTDDGPTDIDPDAGSEGPDGGSDSR